MIHWFFSWKDGDWRVILDAKLTTPSPHFCFWHVVSCFISDILGVFHSTHQWTSTVNRTVLLRPCLVLLGTSTTLGFTSSMTYKLQTLPYYHNTSTVVSHMTRSVGEQENFEEFWVSASCSRLPCRMHTYERLFTRLPFATVHTLLYWSTRSTPDSRMHLLLVQLVLVVDMFQGFITTSTSSTRYQVLGTRY